MKSQIKKSYYYLPYMPICRLDSPISRTICWPEDTGFFVAKFGSDAQIQALLSSD